MTPSIWSVLIIFVVAPLAVIGLVTTIVLLTTSRPEADPAAPGNDDEQAGEDEDEAEGQASEPPGGANDGDPASEDPPSE